MSEQLSYAVTKGGNNRPDCHLTPLKKDSAGLQIDVQSNSSGFEGMMGCICPRHFY